MALDTFYLDPAHYSFNFLGCAAKTDRDGTQKTTKDGKPQFQIMALLQTPTGNPEVVKITIPAEVNAAPMSALHFVGLVARPWAFDGKSGIAYAADSVEVGKPAA